MKAKKITILTFIMLVTLFIFAARCFCASAGVGDNNSNIIDNGFKSLPIVGKGERMEKEWFSKNTKVTMNPFTRIPKKVIGINVIPSDLRDGTMSLSKENTESVFKNFIGENREFFKVNVDELKLMSVNKKRGKWYVKFQQHYKGIPVYHSTVGLSATEQGEIQTYGSNFYPELQVATEPDIDIKEAVEIAKDTYDQEISEDLTEKEVVLIIYPEETDEEIIYHLSWKFLLSGKRPHPDVDKYFIIDAITGEILLGYFSRIPASTAYGTVEGEIYPENPTFPPVTTEPFKDEYVSILFGGQDTTNGDGFYSLPVPLVYLLFNLPYNITFHLEGPFAQVQDFDGSDFSVTRNFSNNPCNFTWTDTDRDHINVFYHINLMHDWYKDYLNYEWTNAWDGTNQFKAEVNYTFNNAYAGSPMLFGTSNFARSSDVIYHECTHNVLYALYGDYIGWPSAFSEAYAMDEGFADYFACALTEDSIHGEGYGGTRNLNNNHQYPGKDAYNIEGHTGGQIIAGAAWDLREMLMAQMGDETGAEYVDNMIFEAHQLMSTMPREYYFSEPQESNFLGNLYIANDNNSNLDDGVPHFREIHRAFANHNLLQATLETHDSFDFSTNIIGYLTGGDLYYYEDKFWANNFGQRGIIDLGNIGTTALDAVNNPLTGYSRFGVSAIVGNTYVSLAQEGEEGNYIVFRVMSKSADNSQVVIEYFYHFNQPPEAICRNVTVSADENCHANASINNGSFDPDPEDTIILTQTPPGPYGLGDTLVTLTVTDNHGVTDVCTATVSVVDTTPPNINTTPVTYMVCIPNDAVVTIQLPEVADNCTNNASIIIEGFVKSIKGQDAGMTPIIDSEAILPLGEHIIEWRATDNSGNQTIAEQTVYIEFMASEDCCESGKNQFIGDDGQDFLYNYIFNPVLTGPPWCALTYGGDDVVNISNESGNYVALGEGNDRVFLSIMSFGGKNIVIGEGGNDYIRTSFSDDNIYGGEGDDYIAPDGGNNIIYGSFDNDIIYGGSGNDVIIPGPGRDIVYGSFGDDTVYVYDICELEFGEILSGELGEDRLYLPVTLAEAASLGISISGFEHVFVIDSTKKGFSECVSP